MATIRSEVKTRAKPSEVWSAIRDVGALHTQLVPGFVTDTKLEPGARIVTFVERHGLCASRSSPSTTRRGGWSGPTTAAEPAITTAPSRSPSCGTE